jgi:metallo-beta-lactamase family protein
VFIDEKRIDIRAGIHTISGYSAHADQDGLVKFATKMKKPPSVIKLVHGDSQSKQTLKNKLNDLLACCKVEIPN